MPRYGSKKASSHVFFGASVFRGIVDKEQMRCKYRYAGAYDIRRLDRACSEWEKFTPLKHARNMLAEEYLEEYEVRDDNDKN